MLVLAIAAWGVSFTGKTIRFWCDNKGVVDSARRRFCKDPDLMSCYRDMQVQCWHFNFQCFVSWIAGEKNVLADLLSRKCPRAVEAAGFSLVPNMTPVPKVTTHAYS